MHVNISTYTMVYARIHHDVKVILILALQDRVNLQHFVLYHGCILVSL